MDHITIDFETFSEAGYWWDEDGKRRPIDKNNPGLRGTGAAVYAQHPTTEILSLAYDFHDGQGPQIWVPGMDNPDALILSAMVFNKGYTIEAHNSAFEWLIWNYCAAKKYGWHPLPQEFLRCSMAKAYAHS